MEGEINNLVLVWATAVASLLYCHKISNLTAQGTTRLCAFLPVLCLFFYLPLRLSTVHLSGITSFFLTWLANFKLLLFAFSQGPLHSNPPLPLSRFIPTACLPIKIIETPFQKIQINGHPSPGISQNGKKSPEIPQNGKNNGHPSREIAENGKVLHEANGYASEKVSGKGKKSPVNYLVKFIAFVMLIRIYDFNEHFNHGVKMVLYCVHIYLVLDVGLVMAAYLVRAMVGVELEPQFDEPYLTTSLQDFWGKRWNLMVTSTLHRTVYLPVRLFSGRFLPKKWASLPAVFASFLVSGLMHELIFYYMGRLKPTWEVTWFFVVHGVLVGLEVVVKRAVDGRFRLPAVVSGSAALGVVVVTSFWWFFPPFLRCDTEIRSCKEFVAFLNFVFRGRYVSPNNVSCPYFER